MPASLQEKYGAFATFTNVDQGKESLAKGSASSDSNPTKWKTVHSQLISEIAGRT
jgi:hypothetical protein